MTGQSAESSHDLTNLSAFHQYPSFSFKYVGLVIKIVKTDALLFPINYFRFEVDSAFLQISVFCNLATVPNQNTQ